MPGATIDRDGPSEESGKQGLSRRRFLGTGAGGVAAAVVFGTGLRPAAAAEPGGAAGGKLTATDPHAHTGRTASRAPAFVDGVRILPIDRAKFQANVRFDLRVEATGVDPETARIQIRVQGPDGPADILTGAPVRTSSAPDSFEVTYLGLRYPDPGSYTITALARSRTSAEATASVTHEVVVAHAGATSATNVIFFLGDGMGQPAITAARLLSKGITEGKYHGLLEMDLMEQRGLVTTSGVDSLATDSANSMSAYMTGHKSSVNAMGVYVGNAPDPNAHPRVENVSELFKRTRDMAIGVVTTADVADATPAAVWAHTRQRGEFIDIIDQALREPQRPDVLLGGGRATFLPQSEEGSIRDDDRDVIEEFQELGYAYAGTETDLRAALADDPTQLLGLFTLGTMNVYLDREHDPDPEVLGDFTDQPTLMDMTRAALDVLGRHDEGFFLMVEAASIDKMEHPLDGPRAVYDAIEFDQSIGLAKQWASTRSENTLIVITADHNHSMSIVGTHDAREDLEPDRQSNGVYADAGYPTYVDSDGDGFPDTPDADVQLFFGWSNHPDHRDDFEHNETFLQPALLNDDGVAVPNPDRDPDALVQVGNLPLNQTNCVHTVEDVPVFASGPGAAGFNAVLDNTEVFHRMIDALGLVVGAEPGAGESEAEVSP